MEDDCVGHRENEQHLHRRKAHLALAANVVADEVAGAKQQLPHAVQDRTRTRSQAPHVHHALTDALPPDAPQTCPLRACRAIVTRELLQRCSTSPWTYCIGSRCQRLKRSYRSLKGCQFILVSLLINRSKWNPNTIPLQKYRKKHHAPFLIAKKPKTNRLFHPLQKKNRDDCTDEITDQCAMTSIYDHVLRLPHALL